jgi:hypothetical protein
MSDTVKSLFGKNVNYYPTYTSPPRHKTHPMNNFSTYSVFKMNNELVQPTSFHSYLSGESFSAHLNRKNKHFEGLYLLGFKEQTF